MAHVLRLHFTRLAAYLLLLGLVAGFLYWQDLGSGTNERDDFCGPAASEQAAFVGKPVDARVVLGRAAPFGPLILDDVGVTYMAFSPDGKEVAWAGFGPTEANQYQVGILSVATGRTKCRRSMPDETTALAWSPGGNDLVLGSVDRPVELLRATDLTTRSQVKFRQGGKSGVTSLRYSSDGRLLAIGTWDHEVGVLDLKAAAYRVLGKLSFPAQHLCFGPDGRSVVAASSVTHLGVWELSGKAAPWKLDLYEEPEATSAVVAGVFHYRGRLAVAGGDGCVRLWDVRSRALLAKHPAGIGEIHKCAVSVDRRSVLLAGTKPTGPEPADSCVLMGLPSGKVVAEFGPYVGRVICVAICPDASGVFIATGRIAPHDPIVGRLYYFPVRHRAPKQK